MPVEQLALHCLEIVHKLGAYAADRSVGNLLRAFQLFFGGGQGLEHKSAHVGGVAHAVEKQYDKLVFARFYRALQKVVLPLKGGDKPVEIVCPSRRASENIF